MADGSYTLYVQAGDSAGNWSVSGNENIVIDTTLSFLEFLQDGVAGVDGLDGAQGIAISPDGKNVYVAGYTEDALAVFDRDTTTGALTYSTVFVDGIGGVDGLDAVLDVSVSSDGKNVYAVGSSDHALAVFDRNTTTGALTYSTAFFDGVAGVDGLWGAVGVAVSPDGKNVYVAGYTDNALAVFDRNTTTGALTYSTAFFDGVAGVDGLAGAGGISVSPDGKNVYTASDTDDSLAVFDRNTTTGALIYSEVFKDGGGGVDGLAEAYGTAVSSDGKSVYGAGHIDDMLAVFDRDTTTGALTFSTTLTDGVAGVDGLGGAYGIAVSSNGQNVYVASDSDDALAVFDR